MREILLVEDNEIIVKGLKYLLEQEKFDIKIAKNIVEAKTIIKKQKFDLYLLDITLPDGDGYEICQYVKKQKDVPVIFLTAKDEELNVVQCLDMGADDYIIKPFRNRELISRIKSVLRRYYHDEINENQIKCRDVIIDSNKAVVYKAGKEIVFTSLEYKILYMLISNKNILVTREQILDKIWDVAGNFVNDNTLTVYIKRIRNKLDDKEGKFIQTVRGIGYKVVE
ncbi:two component transcriptional regulator winged helix family [Clostridium sp. CAG:356]|jgi:DNA-binding response regulator|nr:MAG: DNA-binding response regulator [Clostridium sp. 28_12]CDD36869.1 two component transcriptional regulator winged helix family [Clostridium sp. CAG:356]